MRSTKASRVNSLFTRILPRLLGIAFLAAWLVCPQAFAGFRKPKVLIVNAGTGSTALNDVQTKLNESSQFSAIGVFDALSTTPTLAEMLPYDAVLVFSDAFMANSVTLGNNLDDYVDAGGGVVTMIFSTANISPPAGRWNPGYLSMETGTGLKTGISTLDPSSITNQNHPILIGVGSFSGGSGSYRANQANVVAGATIVAKWSDGTVLASAGPLPGRADLNF